MNGVVLFAGDVQDRGATRCAPADRARSPSLVRVRVQHRTPRIRDTAGVAVALGPTVGVAGVIAGTILEIAGLGRDLQEIFSLYYCNILASSPLCLS